MVSAIIFGLIEYIFNHQNFLLAAIIILLLTLYFYFSKSHTIYLIDFCCYQPPANLRASTAKLIEHVERAGYHDKESVEFQAKVAERSCIGCDSSFPLALHEIPPNKSLHSTLLETETVLFTVVKELLHKHSVNPKDIDILISNCSIFCPTPSITAMIINKFGFRSNVKSVSLSGMGCSAGLVAISLAKDLLKVNGNGNGNNSLALVLSMEAVTSSGYNGSVKSMLLANTLFRMGGVAVCFP